MIHDEGLLIVPRLSDVVKYNLTEAEIGEMRGPNLGLSYEEVAKKYRGFEGDAWEEHDMEDIYHFPPKSGLGSLREFDRIRQILENDFGEDADLIYLGGLDRPLDLPDDFIFAGYDYGCYEPVDHYFTDYDEGHYFWPYSHWSVIYDEIIYGAYPEMIRFGSLLNENLLLARAEDAEPIGATRQSLEKKGCRFEDLDAPCHPIGIWLYVRR